MSGENMTKKCACWHVEARECYRSRYAPVDDFSRSQFFEQMDSEDLKCECVCHDEEDDYYEQGHCDWCKAPDSECACDGGTGT